MSHRQQMQREIKAALNAMPQGMTPRDMAQLFANFLVAYDMEGNADEIKVKVDDIIREHFINEHKDELMEMCAEIDAAMFLAKCQGKNLFNFPNNPSNPQ